MTTRTETRVLCTIDFDTTSFNCSVSNFSTNTAWMVLIFTYDVLTCLMIVHRKFSIHHTITSVSKRFQPQACGYNQQMVNVILVIIIG